MTPRRLLLLLALLALAAGAAPAAAQEPPPLEVGVGRADITPPVVGSLGGWANAEAVPRGVHTRLFARAIVLRRGERKVAILTVDLSFVGAGLVQHATERAGRGFGEHNVLVSASHTHGSPIGHMNFSTYNTTLPTLRRPVGSDAQPNDTAAMYAFMVERLALALRRADDDLAPGLAGWGSSALHGITQNRSLEAHLAGHGILALPGQGRVGDDPLGEDHTADPAVDVLRVDKLIGERRVPVGMWSSFANHGTVNHFTWDVFHADHNGPASRHAEAVIRAEGDVPDDQEVVNAYGSNASGDLSAGLVRSGPAATELVGRAEAEAMLDAWREAGRRMDRRPDLDVRWTRMCFCGQETAAGPTDTEPVIGAAAGSGSEEARTIFNPPAGSYEGVALPVDVGAQGRKIQTLRQAGSVPQAVPLMILRVGDRAIATVPGEMTTGMGRRTEELVLGTARAAGIRRVLVAGLTGEYVSYFASPEEYDAQHYEGGFTLYGRNSALAIAEGLANLGARLADGSPAPPPHAYDVVRGRNPVGRPWPPGATAGEALEQPGAVERLQRARFAWRGGPNGTDRRLDRAFVTVERRSGGDWRRAADDLGLQIVWRTGPDGRYTALWEVPLDAAAGEHRFRVLAEGYELVSEPFAVRPSTALRLEPAERGRAARLRPPAAVPYEDFTDRPEEVDGGAVRFSAGGQEEEVARERGGTFRAPFAGATVAAGAARDRFGNVNGEALTLP